MTKKINKIAFWPQKNDYNEFININVNIVKKFCNELVDIEDNMKNMLDADLVFFSWFEGIFGKNIEEIEKYYLSKTQLIKLLKERNIKIVTFFHNKVPHDLPKLNLEYSIKFAKYLYDFSDKLIVLNNASKKYLSDYLPQETVENKSMLINHPNYINVYDGWRIKAPQTNRNDFRVLFLGMIRPYKNIELIFKLANEFNNSGIKFIVAGYPLDFEYVIKLNDQSKNLRNLKFIPQAILGENLSNLVSECDAFALPYNTDSAINSGPFFLAASYGKTSIMPNTPAVDEYSNSLVYKYEYMSHEDHFDKLFEATKQAYDDWKNDKVSFYDKGSQLFEKVKTENSIKVLTSQYNSLFETLGY